MEKERKRNDGKENVKKSIHCYGCRNNDDSNARNAGVSDIGNEKITVGTTKLNVNESVFTKGEDAKPGIFRYVVSEVAADKDGNAYEGVAYTTEQKYFDVYVTSDDDGNLEVSSYLFADKG